MDPLTGKLDSVGKWVWLIMVITPVSVVVYLI